MRLTYFFSDVEDVSGPTDRLGGGYPAALSEASEYRPPIETSGALAFIAKSELAGAALERLLK